MRSGVRADVSCSLRSGGGFGGGVELRSLARLQQAWFMKSMISLEDQLGFFAQPSSDGDQLARFGYGLARFGDQFTRREHVRLRIRNCYLRSACSVWRRNGMRHASCI